jgi:hemerythrin
MPLVQWSDKISVGVGMLDDDHRRLVEILNDCYDAVLKERKPEVLGDIMDSLIAYANTHFKREEDLFEETAYPDAVIHKKNHQEALRRLIEIQSKFRAGASVSLCNELLQFLADWLANHVIGMDQKYTKHLNAHGIR